MKFIDANIIAYAYYENEYQEYCQKIIREGGLTDGVVLIEAYNIIENEVDSSHATQAILSILKSNVKVIPVDSTMIFEMLKRRKRYARLKSIDLLHYSVASFHNCREIISLDKDFEGLEIPRKP